MAPSQNYVFNSSPLEPVSRTYQYRKVMKPMLERKRRARINRCLDELKELMVVALQSEGENVSKLEKADILELTVRHLQNLKQKNSLYIVNQSTSDGNNKKHSNMNTDSFWEGFRHCANEVSQFLMRFDQKFNIDFLQYIKNCVPVQNLNLNIVKGNNGNHEFLKNISTDNKTQFSPSLISNNPFVINQYNNNYHQKMFMYNNGNNNNNNINNDNLNEKNLSFLNLMENRNSSIPTSKSSTISSVLTDNDSTVWRPW